MKVYLDACCLSRLTDDQAQSRIRDEAEAIEEVLAKTHLGIVDLIGSDVLDDEVRRIPSVERRLEVEALLSLATKRIEVDENIVLRARELNRAGYGPYDSLHLAAAESAEADVLLSTDDRLVKRAARAVGEPRIPVRNPVSWIKEQ